MKRYVFFMHVQPAAGAPAFMKPSGRLERDTTAEQLRAIGGDAGVTKDLGLGYSIPQPAAAEVVAPAAAAAAPGGAGGGSSSRQQQQQAGSKPSGSSKSRSSSGSGNPKPKGGAPIILVPSGVSALFNMYNARQFLQDGVYVKR
jgi:hypothetical protein